GNEQLKADAIRWLRGEFTTKTDARAALGVRTCIDDASIYDQLKLLSRFVRLAGFGGLMVCLHRHNFVPVLAWLPHQLLTSVRRYALVLVSGAILALAKS
ncbi:BREX system ATP-binding domain-containing protein, partial [Pseudomonas viridiflava]|uniref:BREX system ATP-binding domain-containing protein n=1 Tax=Pseudomonas viridiflava TaxID=33069 RepID=UPI001F1529C5